MIKGTTIKETVEAKAAYERILHEYGHKVEAYYGDNIRFDSAEFQTACKVANLTYTYCKVGAHHQNGIAEYMNKRHSHNFRTALLHAKRKWPEAVEERHNRLDIDSNGMSPLEVLLGHKEEIVGEDYHSWGCAIFVLDSKLQSGQGIGPPKWDPRA
eukprot:14141543-Ditylum_brightwellii.AAC.1